MNLSIKQKEVVEHIDGALLVKAGPGSGKTRVLIERIKHLLSAKKRGKILALTFSNMAAEEMRSRLENDAKVSDSIERVTVNTIHSFCLDLVQSRGYLLGLRSDISLFENEADRIAILSNLMLREHEYASLLKRQEKPKDFLRDCLLMISEQKRGLILPDASSEIEPFPSIYQKYNEELSTQNAMDFDDILFYSYRILAENTDIVELYNSVYRFVCIDEAQDLNEAQYRVIQALCGDSFRNIMMVGDENQSIYAFNGSSSKFMTTYFVRDFSPTTYSLNENFRSAKKIIRYANTLTGDTEDISRYVYEGTLRIHSHDNEVAEAEFVRGAIEHLIVRGHKEIEGEVIYDKIAIIARNKYVLSSVEEELTQAGIPFYYKKTSAGIVNETAYMKAFDLILRLIINPLDIFHRQLLEKIAGLEVGLYDRAEKVIEQLLINSEFNWLINAVQIMTPEVANFDKVLKCLREDVPQNIADENKYMLLKDIDEWENHWKRYKFHIASEHRSLVSFRNAIALGKTQNTSSDSGVSLLTAHMSKGLEFEIVFIIGLTEGTFPDYRAVKSEGEAMAQEKNNMYVAATRAKRLCYLSYPQKKKMPWGDIKVQQPSRFIANYASD